MRSRVTSSVSSLKARLELALLLGRVLLGLAVGGGVLPLVELDSTQIEPQLLDRVVDLPDFVALDPAAASVAAPGLWLKRAEPRLDLGWRRSDRGAVDPDLLHVADEGSPLLALDEPGVGRVPGLPAAIS